MWLQGSKERILCNNMTEKFEKTDERFEEQIEVDGEEAVRGSKIF